MEHLRYLEHQFLNENLADIIFVIDNDLDFVKIPSHKVILSAGSLPLAQRFTESSDLKKIEILNSTKASFEEFLFSFYSPNPEKNFTIANAPNVLTLAKTFQVVHCFKAVERFLMKNLPLNQMCFGYCIAVEFGLVDLKQYCLKQINEKKRDVFMTQTFFACDEKMLHDILENVIVESRDEIEMVWNACMQWAEKQCILRSIKNATMMKRRELLGKCFNQIQSFAAKDADFLNYVMENYKDLFDNNMNRHESNKVTFNVDKDINQNLNEEFIISRFPETILSPQTCHANAPIEIELQSTKRIALNGIALATVSGSPKGKIIIKLCSSNKILVEQQIHSKVKCKEINNFIAIENVVLEPNTAYIITVEFIKDMVYRSSRRIQNIHRNNGLIILFKSLHRDIFSHFCFSECF